MSLRHRLLPGVRVLRRGPYSIQVGPGVSSGLVLDGLDSQEIRFVESLQADTTRYSSQPQRTPQLLRLLVDSGLCAPLRDTPTVRTLDIAVLGQGELPARLADALTMAGHRLTEADRPTETTDLAVLAGVGGVPYTRADIWRDAGVPHLPVAVDGREVHVGPLVKPPGPCLHCVDLWRAQTDPAWPVVLAQLATASSWSGLPLTCADSARIALAAALTMRQISRFASASSGPRPAPRLTEVGGTPEPARRRSRRRTLPSPTSVGVTEPDWTFTHHEWPLHPRCPGHPVRSIRHAVPTSEPTATMAA